MTTAETSRVRPRLLLLAAAMCLLVAGIAVPVASEIGEGDLA
jgi:hypothetical protein